MIKWIQPGAQIFDEPVLTLIKRSSRGLIGSDRQDFYKRASFAFTPSVINEAFEKSASGEHLIHMLAVGATERFSANRNGDGFRREMCSVWHPTFEKLALFFRNHINRDPRKSYGYVVKSAFNREMDRIELIVGLYGDKKAADRKKALVADKELDNLHRGKDIPVSMSCKIAFDVCSYCRNESPTTDSYCVGTHLGGKCKAGGLRDNMGALLEIDGDVHHLHADNPRPHFFDISHVYRPADRIAYVTGLLEKAASDNRVLKSADLAKAAGITVPYIAQIYGVTSPIVQRLLKTAAYAVEIEADLDNGQWRDRDLLLSVSSEMQPIALTRPTDLQEKAAEYLQAMAASKICLPLKQFVEIFANVPKEKSADVSQIVSRELPGIYSKLLNEENFVDRLSSIPYAADDAQAHPKRISWAEKAAGDLSLSKSAVERRALRGSIQLLEPSLRKALPDQTRDHGSIGRLAEEYALYKLAFLAALPEDAEHRLTSELAIAQNYTH